jgi:hypothetical protein
MLIWAERDKKARAPRGAAGRASGMERANAGIMGGLLLALPAMPALAGVGALAGAFAFNGSQDLLGSKALTPELPLFLLLWAAGGALLGAIRPELAWQAATAFAALILFILPLLAIAAADPLAGFGRRGGGFGDAGYTRHLLGPCRLSCAAGAPSAPPGPNRAANIKKGIRLNVTIRSLLLASLASGALTAPAHAQEADSSDDITVVGQANRGAATTATRVPLEALETPFTISVLPGRIIEESGARTPLRRVALQRHGRRDR